MSAHTAAVLVGEFACQLCGRNFSNATSLRIHEQYSHATSVAVSAECASNLARTTPLYSSTLNGLASGVTAKSNVYSSEANSGWMSEQVPVLTQLPYSRTPPVFVGSNDEQPNHPEFWQSLTSAEQLHNGLHESAISNEMSTGHWVDSHFPPTPDSGGYPGSTGSSQQSKSPREEAAEILDLDSNRVQLYTAPPIMVPSQHQQFLMQQQANSPLPGNDINQLEASSASQAFSSGQNYFHQQRWVKSMPFDNAQFDKQSSLQQSIIPQTHYQQQMSSAAGVQCTAGQPPAMVSGKVSFVESAPFHQYAANMSMHVTVPQQSRDNYAANRYLNGPSAHMVDIENSVNQPNASNARRTKTYHCDVCDKKFTSMGHLKRHYNTIVHRQTKEGKRAAAMGLVGSHQITSQPPRTQPNGNKSHLMTPLPPLVSVSSAICSDDRSSSNSTEGGNNFMAATKIEQTSPQFPITPPLQDTPQANTELATNVDVQKLSQHQQQLFEQHQQQLQRQHLHFQHLQQEQQHNPSFVTMPNSGQVTYKHQQQLMTANYQIEKAYSSGEHSIQNQLSSQEVRTGDVDNVCDENQRIITDPIAFQPYSNNMVTTALTAVTSEPFKTANADDISRNTDKLPIMPQNEPILNTVTDASHSPEGSINHENCREEFRVDDGGPTNADLDGLVYRQSIHSTCGGSEDRKYSDGADESLIQVTTSCFQPEITASRGADKHLPVEQNALTCCGRVFAGLAYYKQHMDSKHGGATDEHITKCLRCNRRHSVDAPCDEPERQLKRQHQCETCEKTFSHFSDLKRHRYTHLSEKPFMCSQCGRGFIRKDQMEKHMQTHDLQQTGFRQVSTETSLASARIEQTGVASPWQSQLEKQHNHFGVDLHSQQSDSGNVNILEDRQISVVGSPSQPVDNVSNIGSSVNDAQDSVPPLF